MDLRESDRIEGSRHPWETTRFDFFLRLLQAHSATASPQRVLDVGSGDGWFASRLARRLAPGSQVTCWDVGYSAEAIAAAPARLVRTAAAPTTHANVLLFLDVLEHVEHDQDFLGEVLTRNAAPGALVLVSVPAWPLLRTSHDDYLRHYRRYTTDSARALIRSSPLQIVQEGGLFHSLLAVRAANKLLGLVLPKPKAAQENAVAWNHGPLFTRLITAALRVDTRTSSFLAENAVFVPGLSWWALCKMP